jgi:hypothetical protein
MNFSRMVRAERLIQNLRTLTNEQPHFLTLARCFVSKSKIVHASHGIGIFWSQHLPASLHSQLLQRFCFLLTVSDKCILAWPNR